MLGVVFAGLKSPMDLVAVFALEARLLFWIANPVELAEDFPGLKKSPSSRMRLQRSRLCRQSARTEAGTLKIALGAVVSLAFLEKAA